MPGARVISALPVVCCVAAEDRGILEKALHDAGYVVLELDGRDVHDKRSLLQQIAVDLLDGVAHPPGTWDGLFDSLWQALAGRSETAVAIQWGDAGRMLEGALEDLIVAAQGFAALARQVGTTERGFPRAVTLRVVLLGTGPNFPRFPRESGHSPRR